LPIFDAMMTDRPHRSRPSLEQTPLICESTPTNSSTAASCRVLPFAAQGDQRRDLPPVFIPMIGLKFDRAVITATLTPMLADLKGAGQCTARRRRPLLISPRELQRPGVGDPTH
jgi:hypothetical protein